MAERDEKCMKYQAGNKNELKRGEDGFSGATGGKFTPVKKTYKVNSPKSAQFLGMDRKPNAGNDFLSCSDSFPQPSASPMGVTFPEFQTLAH
jgi:hypothetical protein